MNPQLVKKCLPILAYISPRLAGKWAVRIFSSPRRIPRPPWEEKLIGKGSRDRLAGGLNVFRFGDRAAPAVVLVHGWQGRGTQLGFLVEPLNRLGYQVIALDGLAHGDSPGTRTHVKFFADSILQVGQQIGREAGPLRAVVAHSFGAAALMYAMAHGLDAEAAVLVAAPSRIQWILESFAKRMRLGRRASKAFQRELEAWAGAKTEDFEIEKLGPAIRAPALIVHDPEDPDVPFKNAEEFAAAWPNARLLVLHGVGHRKILKSPEFISAVGDFLGEALKSPRK